MIKENLLRKWIMAGVLGALQALPALAQNGPTGAPSLPQPASPQTTSSAPAKPATDSTSPGQTSAPHASSAAPSAPVVGEIEKMVQAGVSKDVIKAYIEGLQMTSPLSSADVVALKEHGVPDDLTIALLKRSGELTAQASRTAASNAVPPQVSGTVVSLNALAAALRNGQPGPGYLDPESYDYFRYYYLYPRTLADANQRIISSYAFPAYPAYPSGCWPGWAFAPRPFVP